MWKHITNIRSRTNNKLYTTNLRAPIMASKRSFIIHTLYYAHIIRSSISNDYDSEKKISDLRKYLIDISRNQITYLEKNIKILQTSNDRLDVSHEELDNILLKHKECPNATKLFVEILQTHCLLQKQMTCLVKEIDYIDLVRKQIQKIEL
jgi:hypothetical protein